MVPDIVMAPKRTTLTLDEDVARLLDDAMRRTGTPRRQIVNDALRRAPAPPDARDEPYRLTPHVSAVLPGFDPAGFNQLDDELDGPDLKWVNPLG
jgi:hypothetical protein